MYTTPKNAYNGGKTWTCEKCTLWCFNYCNKNALNGVKLGHVKNALFGVLTIAMYTTQNALFGVVYIIIVKTPKSAFFT